MKTHLKYFLPVLFYSILIFYLSSLSNPLPIITKNIWDKLIHFFEYSFYFFFLYGGFSKFKVEVKKKEIILSFIIATLFAASDEIHQSVVPGRFCDFKDFLADTFGISFCILLFVIGARHEKNSD